MASILLVASGVFLGIKDRQPLYFGLAAFFGLSCAAVGLRLVQGPERTTIPRVRSGAGGQDSNYDPLTANALRAIIRRSPQLGDADSFKALGCQVAIAIDRYASVWGDLLNRVEAGDWKGIAREFKTRFEPAEDCVQLAVLERTDGEGVVIELSSPSEFSANDECHFVRRLTRDELEAARPYIKVWFALRPSGEAVDRQMPK